MTAATGNLSIEGSTVHYNEAGAGEPVLLLHGIPTSGFLWRNVQLALKDEYRTLALDLLGFGASDKPEDRDLGLEAQAELVARFVRSLGIGAVTLVGHDFGGAVAQVVASRHPGVARRLVLLSSLTSETWPSPDLERFRPAELSRHTTVEDILRHVRATLRRQVARREVMDEATLESYLVPWSTPSGMGAFFRLARSADSRTLQAIEQELGRLWLPALVIGGEADTVAPPDEARRIARLLPTAELELLPGVGHLSPEEAPELVAERIRAFQRRAAKYH